MWSTFSSTKTFYSQAKKRAAWREARLKSLEQDAMQAEMVINASRHNTSMASAISTNDTNDGNGNNNQGEPDNSNNNQVLKLNAAALL